MKKLISLLLLLCLMAGCAAGAEEGAEEEEVPMIPANGYTFDFELKLHPEAFSDGKNERIRGYAELLDALRFQGTFRWADNWDVFDLQLMIIPKEKPDAAVDIWLHGAEDLMFLNSSLLGEKTVALGNSSMLDFCSKMAEHLGIPLQYLGLLYPYSWTYSLGLPIQDWDVMVSWADENGVVPTDRMEVFWSGWKYRVQYDEPLMILRDALCKNSEVEDEFRGMFDEIPDFFIDDVTNREQIRIIRDENSCTYSAAGRDFFTLTDDGTVSRKQLNVQRMRTGYQPVFDLESVRENGCVNCRLYAQMLGDENREDLVNLQASLVSFPETWPVRCYSLMSLSLTGSLLPNVGLAVYLNSDENGHFRAEVRKPTVDMEPGAIMVSVEGNVIPMDGDTTVRAFTLRDLNGALEIFRSNDLQIQAFLPDVVEPLMQGMLRFLVGIPTKACQTIMDDLTDMGVFEVLMGR